MDKKNVVWNTNPLPQPTPPTMYSTVLTVGQNQGHSLNCGTLYRDAACLILAHSPNVSIIWEE